MEFRMTGIKSKTLDKLLTQVCVEKLKILSDESRLAILSLLCKSTLTVGQLNAELGLEQSLLSHHLSKLKRAGFVVSKRVGKFVFYSRVQNLNFKIRDQSIDLGCCNLKF